MNDDLELSIRQFLGAWEVLGKQGPRYERASFPTVEVAFSGLPVAFFNASFTTGRGTDAKAFTDAARRTCEFAAKREVPWLHIVTHETLAPGVDPTALLDPLGLAPLMNFTGMRAERVAPLARVPAGLELLEPKDDEDCASILDVNGLAYEVDLSASKDALGRRAFWKDHAAVIGKVAGKTVCSTVVLFLEGIRYVGFVATDPAHQRKGYADAAMRRALELATTKLGEQPVEKVGRAPSPSEERVSKEDRGGMSTERHGDDVRRSSRAPQPGECRPGFSTGCETTTVLHATDAGRPVYERMGYRSISTHTAFIEKKYLDHST